MARYFETFRLLWSDINFSGSCTSRFIPLSLTNLSGLKAPRFRYMLSSRDIALENGCKSLIISSRFQWTVRPFTCTHKTFSITVVPVRIKYPSYTSSCMDLWGTPVQYSEVTSCAGVNNHDEPSGVAGRHQMISNTAEAYGRFARSEYRGNLSKQLVNLFLRPVQGVRMERHSENKVLKHHGRLFGSQ